MSDPAFALLLPPLGRCAVVVGASLAGLLSARVLAEPFGEVVLVERDALPDGPAPRKGTPHATQPHGLLARGREVVEALFPGFTAGLVARGGLTGDLGLAVAFDVDGCAWRARRPAISASRRAGWRSRPSCGGACWRSATCAR